MKLKTLCKHLIMQNPCIFPNALSVYDHLFYVIGNGYHWKDGILQSDEEFKEKSEEECIQEMIDFHTNIVKETSKEWDDIDPEIAKRAKGRLQNTIEKETYIIKHAEELSEDFTPTERFTFYPISEKYSACTTIPNDIKPDWLEGINKINEIREKLIKENPNLDPHHD